MPELQLICDNTLVQLEALISVIHSPYCHDQDNRYVSKQPVRMVIGQYLWQTVRLV